MQNGLKISLNVLWFGANIPAGDPVERLVCEFSNALSRQGFACSWGTMEQKNQSVAFTFDDIQRLVFVVLNSDEGFEHFFLVLVQDEPLKSRSCLFPIDIFHVPDRKRHLASRS